MQKKNSDWLILFGAGVMLASWVSGCANRGQAGNSIHSQTSVLNSANLRNQSATSQGISGVWLCADTQCADGTLKKISNKLDSVETLQTERLSPGNPQSICRIHETERMSPLRAADHFQLTESAIKLVNSAENTQDCGDVLQKLNQMKPLSVDVEIVHDTATPEITIAGVRYRLLTDLDLKDLSEKRAAADAQNASIAGDWVCIDQDCDSLEQKISNDRLKLTTHSMIELPGENLKCQVSEESQIEITDNTEPDKKLYLTRVHGDVKLADAADNSADCDKIVTDYNSRSGGSGTVDKGVELDRDGNQEIIFLGKRYARKGTNL